jgi:hypothetical protein
VNFFFSSRKLFPVLHAFDSSRNSSPFPIDRKMAQKNQQPKLGKMPRIKTATEQGEKGDKREWAFYKKQEKFFLYENNGGFKLLFS